ncbi:MAG: hypothetical protein QOF52_2629 [Propionibacteriaceae bacterium]|jgi:cytochrome P450|nr:cytochrome [Propionibacteriaceae bacterium]MDX6322771.1 hypothetical protein [Propionibacteriaceae bacterium]
MPGSVSPPTAPRLTAPLAPMPPGNLVWGHLVQRARRPLGLCVDSQASHGDVVRYRMGSTYVNQVTHPDGMQHVLVDARSRYVKGTVFDKTRPMLGNGLLNSEGEEWKHQRRRLQPAFGHRQLDTLAETMTAAIDGVLKEWKSVADSGEPLQLFPALEHLTLTVVLRSLLGGDLDRNAADIGDAFSVAFDVTNRRIRSVAPYWPRMYDLPTPANRSFHRAQGTLDGLVAEVVARRRGAGSDSQPDDLLGLMISAAGADVDGGNSQELHDQVMTMVSAGHETTATALTWLFYLLDRHPDVNEEVFVEVEEVLGDRMPTAADLPKLGYLRRVVQETLRLYPSVWALPRLAVEDDEIGGYRIPRGDIVLLVPYVTHRHPDFWSNPDEFDPDRFLPAARQDAHLWSYIPFGSGPRRCIGDNFAMMEAQLILAMVTQRFRLRGLSDEPVEADASVTLRPRGPVPMQIEPLGAPHLG